MVASLHTHDLATAQSLRTAALAAFERAFAEAERAVRPSPEIESALAWRQTFEALHRGDVHTIRALGGGGQVEWTTAGPVEIPAVDTALETARDAMEQTAATIARKRGAEAANAFLSVASGASTPFRLHVEDWLAEPGAKGAPLKPRTKLQGRSRVKEFEAWLGEQGVPPTFEAVTKAVAGRYVVALQRRNPDPATTNSKVSALSSLWRWAVKRTAAVAVNPWQGQSVRKGTRTGEDGERYKRPFTEAQLTALLSGPATQEIAEAMRVAAMSGMRVGEIYRLRVRDCADGWFRITEGKSASAVRRVPQHSSLSEIVVRRCASAAPADFLFSEGGTPANERCRSIRMVRAFQRYRMACGVHDKAEGSRHARQDFHSFRRWFVSAARQAGHDQATVAAVVGHLVGNLTDDIYSSGPTDAQRRDCVEAVKLPVPAAPRLA